jgi:hypothetical protein
VPRPSLPRPALAPIMPAVSRTDSLAPIRNEVARNVLILPPIWEGNAGRVCPGNGVSVLGL